MDRFRGDERGDSATVGVALIVGITLIGALVVVTLGAAAISDTQGSADQERAEHAMTQFASKAATVALGESESKTTTFPGGSGGVHVDEGDGRMQVWHVNASGENEAESIANSTLGSVSYRNGDRKVTYQGGGVWKGTGNESRMVSPPEFHYRDATLTLPIVNVSAAEGGTAGSSRASIQGGETTREFPDPTDQNRSNPIRDGEIIIVVETDYRQGWIDYFQTRTTGTVLEPEDVHDDITDDIDTDRAAILRLETFGAESPYPWPGRGDSVPISNHVDSHSLEDFTAEIELSNPNQAWVSFHAEEGDQMFEAVLQFDSGQGGDDVCEAEFDTRVMYTNGDVANHWKLPHTNGTNESTEFTNCNGDGNLEVDFSSEENFTLHEDQPDGSSELDWDMEFDNSSEIKRSENQDPITVDAGESLEVGEFVGYYFWEMGPDFSLTVEYGTSGQGQGIDIDRSQSELRIDYDRDGGDRYITYLHVTENEVVVDVS